MEQTRRLFLKQTAFGTGALCGASAFAPISNRLWAGDAASGSPLFAEGEYRKIDSQEREYHISTIRNLEKQLQLTKLDNYAMRRERGDDVDARDYVYENPEFESDFARNGHAKTVLRRRAVRRGA